MALGTTNQGFSFSPVYAQEPEAAIQFAAPLAGLAPVAVLRQEDTFRPQALTGFDYHPEYIAQGVTNATNSIFKGIEAAYKSKADEDKEKKKYDQELKLAQIKAGGDAEKKGLELELLQKRIDAVGGNKGSLSPLKLEKSDSEVPSTSTEAGAEEVPDEYNPESSKFYLKGVEPIKTENGVGELSDEQKNILNNLNLDIFSPVKAKYVSASGTAPAGALADVPSAVQQTPSMPIKDQMPQGWTAAVHKATIPSLYAKEEGQVNAQADLNEAISKGIEKDIAKSQQAPMAGVQAPTPAAKVNPALEQAIGVSGPWSMSDAQQIKQYAAQKGIEDLVIKPSKDSKGNYEIEWPSAASMEATRARKEATSSRLDIQKQNIANREAAQFQSHPDIKAFTAPNGMRQSLSRFIRDYDAVLKNPESAGISDVGLLDMFARAEGGGRVTEGQANLALSSMGLGDKARQLGMRLEGGDRLSQNQRDQMLRVITEDHAAQVKIANQAVEMTRRKLQKQGISDEDMLPQHFIHAKTKWEATQDIVDMKKEALSLNEARKQAEQSGDKTRAEQIKKQMQEIGNKAVELRKKIDKSKSGIINLDELEGTPQGWSGGATTILMQQP
jgi:hypothetical protein